MDPGSPRAIEAFMKVKIEEEEMALLREHVLVAEPKVMRELDRPRAAGEPIVLELDLDDLDDIIGCLAASSNDASDENLVSRLDELVEKLETFEDEMME